MSPTKRRFNQDLEIVLDGTGPGIYIYARKPGDAYVARNTFVSFVGERATTQQKEWEFAGYDGFSDTIQAREALVEKFTRLADEWEDETAVYSSIQRMIAHPTYRRIVGMGQRVVPLILDRLRKEPGHWFDALESLTGESPVVANFGDMQAMSAAWVNWGKRNLYLT